MSTHSHPFTDMLLKRAEEYRARRQDAATIERATLPPGDEAKIELMLQCRVFWRNMTRAVALWAIVLPTLATLSAFTHSLYVPIIGLVALAALTVKLWR